MLQSDIYGDAAPAAARRLISHDPAYDGRPAPGIGYNAQRGVRFGAQPDWKRTAMGWPIVPQGFERLLGYIKRSYSPKGGIWVTENGAGLDEPTREEGLEDWVRVKYFQGYIAAMQAAIAGGADVRGYCAWSLLDNWEWAYGFTKRFGLVRVDYDTLQRTPKRSAWWYAELIAANAVPY